MRAPITGWRMFRLLVAGSRIRHPLRLWIFGAYVFFFLLFFLSLRVVFRTSHTSVRDRFSRPVKVKRNHGSEALGCHWPDGVRQIRDEMPNNQPGSVGISVSQITTITTPTV